MALQQQQQRRRRPRATALSALVLPCLALLALSPLKLAAGATTSSSGFLCAAEIQVWSVVMARFTDTPPAATRYTGRVTGAVRYLIGHRRVDYLVVVPRPPPPKRLITFFGYHHPERELLVLWCWGAGRGLDASSMSRKTVGYVVGSVDCYPVFFVHYCHVLLSYTAAMHCCAF